MRPEDINFWLRATPFKPFRIVLNSGRTYVIRHPEMLRVGRSSVIFFWFSTDEEDAPYERAEMLSLVLIERIEPVEATAASA
jgi:hypothetical protein